jgi:hypothetical protein
MNAVAPLSTVYGSIARALSSGQPIWQDVRNFLMLPALLGALLGSAVGCAVWVTRTSRHVALSALVLSWGLLGGMVFVLLPTGVIFLYPLAFGSVGRDGSGGGGVFLLMLVSELLTFAMGSLVGAVVGGIKARKRKPRPPAVGIGAGVVPGRDED